MERLHERSVDQHVDLGQQFALILLYQALKRKARVAPHVFLRPTVYLPRQFGKACRLVHRVAPREGDAPRVGVGHDDAHNLLYGHLPSLVEIPRLRVVASLALMTAAGTVDGRPEPRPVDHRVLNNIQYAQSHHFKVQRYENNYELWIMNYELFCIFAARNEKLKQMKKLFAYLIILVTALTSCSTNAKKYRIGVSQCSADIWREKQNAELRMGAYLQGNVELRFAAAYDSDERQVQQIDSLVATGIDLLIVAPNQVATISPAIDRAYDKGIPVIVFERKTNSEKYTAFISADNYEMGRVMGEYIATQLHGQGRVMEIMGLKGSSPAIERHNGFADALKSYPDINIVATLQGDWTEESAVKAVNGYKGDLSDLDFVFGQNDRMAIGARQALKSASTRFCGIDGLPGENGGIQLVRDSILDASYIYPTHGDQLIQLAIDILDGKPYEKETLMMSALVTPGNARVLLMQNEEIMRQSGYLDQLHQKADGYLHELDTQRIVNWMAVGVIALLLLTLVLLYLYHLRKIALQHERVVNTLWNMKPEDLPAPTENTNPAKDAEPAVDSDTTKTLATPDEDEDEPAAVSLFITRFKEVVEARLDDSDVSVEDLAADMNLSRVQLYRKVKSITGSSPVELLRNTRLKKAYQLLLTTDKSVSEVAYTVGFTAPSYFTKCFKNEYGMVPGEVKK